MKAALLIVFLVGVGQLSSSVSGQNYIGGCNEVSRICDEWTLGTSGVWKSCEDTCKEEKYNGGRCQVSPDCSKKQSYKCRCH